MYLVGFAAGVFLTSIILIGYFKTRENKEIQALEEQLESLGRLNECTLESLSKIKKLESSGE